MVDRHDIKALKKQIDGRPIVASISGGKDSAAMSLYLTELGLEHSKVFMDTGWEHPLTLEYLRGPLTDKIGPIEEIRGTRQMEEMILHKGMFPSRMRRWCTQELKVRPMIRFLKRLKDEPINAVGIRSEESTRRSRMLAWERQEGFDCDVWRPILSWTFEDVVAIHKRHGLDPNPLYTLGSGANRVGCWPCILSRKSEIKFVAEHDPDRIVHIRTLEERATEVARRRYAEQGESLESRGYSNPSFFQAKDGSGECWPIDKVVRWSRTAHGGKQFELFAATDEDAGCMRWGLCDLGTEGE